MDLIKKFQKACEEQKKEVDKYFRELGEEGVEYAKKNGNYRDRTRRLRNSNKYKVENGTLTLMNTSPYASDVESKGYDVLGGAKLHIMKKLDLK